MKKRYIIGGIVLVIAVGYLLFMSFSSSVTYYVTVRELLEEGVGTYDTNIRVTGKIADRPISWDAEELELSFVVEEGGAYLPVVYDGSRPDGFAVDADVLLEGKYTVDRVFEAYNILMKCPSKYAPED